MLPRLASFALGLAAPVLALTAAPALAAPQRSAPPGTVAPQTLPGAGAVAAKAEPARWLVVDGTGDVDAVTAHIVDAVRVRLGPEPEHGR